MREQAAIGYQLSANSRRLELRDEALLEVSAAVAARDARMLERALRFADRFAEPASVDEVLLQSHLFVGFPLALEALALWRRVAPRDGTRADAESSAGQAEQPEDLATIVRGNDGVEESPAVSWATVGEGVCRQVYGANYEKLRASMQGVQPDMDRWMVEWGYGRVLSRHELDLPMRELCIVALLAVWDAPRQLHSHLRGALNVGASAQEVSGAIEVACRYLEPRQAHEVRDLWASVSKGVAARAGS
jgi:4-carboxymuconolactone decarboxylase